MPSSSIISLSLSLFPLPYATLSTVLSNCHSHSLYPSSRTLFRRTVPSDAHSLFRHLDTPNFTTRHPWRPPPRPHLWRRPSSTRILTRNNALAHPPMTQQTPPSTITKIAPSPFRQQIVHTSCLSSPTRIRYPHPSLSLSFSNYSSITISTFHHLRTVPFAFRYPQRLPLVSTTTLPSPSQSASISSL